MLRSMYNAWAHLTDGPKLPAPGVSFRYLTAALPLVLDSDCDTFRMLMNALLRQLAGGPWDYLLLALHEADPLSRLFKDFRATWYTTHLYLVCWEDGEALRLSLDNRPPYLELGCL
jgi:hypothetical protein